MALSAKKPAAPPPKTAEEIDHSPITSIRSLDEAMGHIENLRANKRITTDVLTVAREVYLLNHGTTPREKVQELGKELATKHVVRGLSGFRHEQVQAWVWVWMAMETKDNARRMLHAFEEGRT